MSATNVIRLCYQQFGHGTQFIDSEMPSDTKKKTKKQTNNKKVKMSKYHYNTMVWELIIFSGLTILFVTYDVMSVRDVAVPQK